MGLIKAAKSNMEVMADTIENTNAQSLHHFLSNSQWSYRDVMDHVAQDVSEVFSGRNGTCLLVDESCFAKKGDHSAGVKRQWNGRLGKIDNSQVGVFTVLSCGRDAALIDGELFLPEDWCKNNKRCAKAKIPKDKRQFRNKLNIALGQIKRAKENGVEFGWVGADSFYGRSVPFASTLSDWSLTFVLDVPSNYRIYEKNPCPASSGRTHQDATGPGMNSEEVSAWLARQDARAWRTLTIRKGTKGPLKAKILVASVWVWDGESAQAHQWRLIVRSSLDGTDKKFSISNAPQQCNARKLAYMQSQRHFVERAFQDAKSQVGMAEYQTRGWESWHRHMALVMMALLFFLKEKNYMRETLPYVTIADVVMYYAVAIPTKQEDADAVFDILLRRNEQRHRMAIDLFGENPPCNGLFV